MRVTVVGCGDAFGSGNRLQTAYLLDHALRRTLIDCGATTIQGLGQLRIDPNGISAIVITHLHGDHFAGVIWFLMHAVIVAKRTAPLAIYGPRGIAARVKAVGELLYPGMFEALTAFKVTFHEMSPAKADMINEVKVSVFEVDHPSGAPSHAVRCEASGKTFAFTGDSTWTVTLVAAGRNADLYFMECYQFDKVSSVHLNWITLQPQLERIGARRTVLTHMSADMLARRGEIKDGRISFAEDGAVYDI